jgi:hypothetical protein
MRGSLRPAPRRAGKREALLQATEAEPAKITLMVEGPRGSLRDAEAGRIVQRAGRALIGNTRLKTQIGIVEWISEYPAASGFFNPILTCASFRPDTVNNSNLSEFCDPRIDRQIAQALSKQTTSPAAASGLWERIDRQTVN